MRARPQDTKRESGNALNYIPALERGELVLRLEIPGRPIPKGRPRKGKHGNLYTPSETRAYEDSVAWYALNARVKFNGLVKVRCEFHQRRPFTDADNCLKAVLDGLQKGGAIRNDVDVVALAAKRVEVTDASQEKTVVEVEPA